MNTHKKMLVLAVAFFAAGAWAGVVVAAGAAAGDRSVSVGKIITGTIGSVGFKICLKFAPKRSSRAF